MPGVGEWLEADVLGGWKMITQPEYTVAILMTTISVLAVNSAWKGGAIDWVDWLFRVGLTGMAVGATAVVWWMAAS